MEDRDEALLCEGSCDQWLHRYCAGVTETQYEALRDSPLPFLCSICSQLKQTAAIKDMQEKIDSLTAEVVALRSNVADLRTELRNAIGSKASGEPDATCEKWTEVVRRGNRRAGTSNAATGSQSKHKANHFQQRNVSKPQQQRRSLQGVSVPGARRIWGTLKSTTTRAVEKVITTLTKVSSSELRIKRKYKTVAGNSTRWWFVIRGQESVLEQLQKEWNFVAIQTNWKLTPLLQFTTPIHEAQLPDELPNPDPNNPGKSAGSHPAASSDMQQTSSNEQVNACIVQQPSQSIVDTPVVQQSTVTLNDTPGINQQPSQSTMVTVHQLSVQEGSHQSGTVPEHAQIPSLSQTGEQGQSNNQADGSNFLAK